MLDVSNDFAIAIKDTIRKIKAKLEITWSDPTADLTTSVAASAANYISWEGQCVDTIELASYKYFYLNSLCTLDGSFHPAPSTATEAKLAQMGWWGSDESGVGGAFASAQTLTVGNLDGFMLQILKVVGDSQYEEYPKDFTIKIYTGSGITLYDTITVTNNEDINYQYEYVTPISDVRSMELSITKWSVAGTVCKILEFSYATTIKTSNDILSMTLLEEKEIRDGTIPIGNISANELSLTLNNIEIDTGTEKIKDPYFPSNPLSVFAPFVKPNRKIKAWLGIELPNLTIEYTPLGTFWSGDWQVEEVSNDAKTLCRDRMELFRKTEHKGDWLLENTTLYLTAIKLMESIIIDCVMPDLTYNIDTSLNNFQLDFAFFPRQSYFQCIKDIATACGGVAYMNRNDILIIESGY